MVEELIEPAHVAIVQITSVLALLAALIALYYIGKAFPKFTKGFVKTITGYKLVQIGIFAAAMVFMVIYHVWDLDLFQDLWHIAALVALAVGAYVAIRIAVLSRKLSA